MAQPNTFIKPKSDGLVKRLHVMYGAAASGRRLDIPDVCLCSRSSLRPTEDRSERQCRHGWSGIAQGVVHPGIPGNFYESVSVHEIPELLKPVLDRLLVGSSENDFQGRPFIAQTCFAPCPRECQVPATVGTSLVILGKGRIPRSQTVRRIPRYRNSPNTPSERISPPP